MQRALIEPFQDVNHVMAWCSFKHGYEVFNDWPYVVVSSCHFIESDQIVHDSQASILLWHCESVGNVASLCRLVEASLQALS